MTFTTKKLRIKWSAEMAEDLEANHPCILYKKKDEIMSYWKTKKEFPLLQTGMLVEVIEAADQGYFTKALVGKVGLIVKNTQAKSSPNVWEVLIEDKIFNLHALDLKVVG